MSNRWKPTGADVVACLVTGTFSAFLWWRAIDQIGVTAPVIGAAIGIGIGYLCRSFC